MSIEPIDPNFTINLVKSIIALFVIVDPIGLIPIVLSLTSNMSKEERRHTINIAIYTSSILLAIFALAGQQLLAVFGISLESFSIAGGLLLLALAFELLLRGWKQESTTREVGAIPLAFPLMAGPGAITTVIITLESYGLLIAMLSIAIVLGLVFVTFHFINPLYRLLGRIGILVISKVMAIFIAAIAIEFILNGVNNIISS